MIAGDYFCLKRLPSLSRAICSLIRNSILFRKGKIHFFPEIVTAIRYATAMSSSSRSFLVIASRILFPVALIISLYQATSHSPIKLSEANGDKILHLLAFFILAVLDDFAFPGRGFGLRKILPLICYGILIEYIQSFLPYRSSDFYDFLADCGGLAIYALLIPLLKHIPLMRERWKD
jgi:VanZ family protein